MTAGLHGVQHALFIVAQQKTKAQQGVKQIVMSMPE